MTREIRAYSDNEALVRKRRNHIVQCAIKLFYKKGYNVTTIRELAKACGMSEGNIYRYIGSKADILHLTCQLFNRSEQLKQLLPKLANLSRTDALRHSIKEFFSWHEDENDQERVLFFNREIRNFPAEDRRILLKDQEDIQEFFQNLLIEGIKAGEFKDDNPTLTAHNILMFGHDWALRRWFLKKRFTFDEYTKKQTDVILKIIQFKQL